MLPLRDPDRRLIDLRGLYCETALAASRNSLLPTLEVTGADHILFGTDWPAVPETTVVHNNDNLTSFDGFTPDELCAVERDNALRLFPQFGEAARGPGQTAATARYRGRTDPDGDFWRWFCAPPAATALRSSSSWGAVRGARQQFSAEYRPSRARICRLLRR
jgi:hypothetical protein